MQGEGNAAKAVADVRAGLDGVDQTAGNMEKGLKGIKDIFGSLPGPVGALAEGFGGAEKILQVMPGHVGLIATGLVAAGSAAFLLYQQLAQTEAKVQSLGDDDTRRLADSLDLGVDAAIKLQQALGDLPSRIRPTETILQAVVERAEAMGLEGGDAATKFAAALAKGPEALREFEREFGRLGGAVDSLPSAAERLGLSSAALGIATQVGNEVVRAKAAAEEAVVQDRLRASLLSQLATLEREATGATVARRVEQQAQRASLEQQVALYADLVAGAVSEANALQAVVAAQQDSERAARGRAANATLIAGEIALIEAQAGVQLDKQEGLRLRLEASRRRDYEIQRRTVELEAHTLGGLVEEAQARKELTALKLAAVQAAAGDLALGKQAAADLSARRQKGRQAADAEIAARIRLTKAEAEAATARAKFDKQDVASSAQSVALRFRELDQVEQAEVSKARRDANTARGRETAIQAIRIEFASKRQQIEQGVSDELTATLEAQAKRTVEIGARTAALVAAGAAGRSSALAERLRESGDHERADLVERRQAWVDYQGELSRINAEIALQLDGTNAESEDRRNLEREQLEAHATAYESMQERLNQADARRNQRLRESISASMESIRAPAALLASSGGPSAKMGKALEATLAGVQRVSGGWKNMKDSSGDAISAVGGVAAAFVDGEREKAGILAITETAASIVEFANGNVVAAAGHAAAALLYGGVAGGVIGGSAGSGASAAGSGGAVGGGDTGGGGGGGGGEQGGQVVNVYFGKGFVVGTPQQVGVAVQGALGSLNGTGLKRAKGV